MVTIRLRNKHHQLIPDSCSAISEILPPLRLRALYFLYRLSRWIARTPPRNTGAYFALQEPFPRWLHAFVATEKENRTRLYELPHHRVDLRGRVAQKEIMSGQYLMRNSLAVFRPSNAQ